MSILFTAVTLWSRRAFQTVVKNRLRISAAIKDTGRREAKIATFLKNVGLIKTNRCAAIAAAAHIEIELGCRTAHIW